MASIEVMKERARIAGRFNPSTRGSSGALRIRNGSVVLESDLSPALRRLSSARLSGLAHI